MCGTADSLMVTQYVGYSRQFNGDTMCGTADSLMVTQYVRYSGQFNGDTICRDANGSVYNESAKV